MTLQKPRDRPRGANPRANQGLVLRDTKRGRGGWKVGDHEIVFCEKKEKEENIPRVFMHGSQKTV